MKRFLIFMLLAFPLRAQLTPQATSTGSITASGATCNTTNACVTIHLENYNPATPNKIFVPGVIVTLSGTWSATMTFESSTDNQQTWTFVRAVTFNGTWRFTLHNMTDFRVRTSVYSSGSAVVLLTAASDVNSLNGFYPLSSSGSPQGVYNCNPKDPDIGRTQYWDYTAGQIYYCTAVNTWTAGGSGGGGGGGSPSGPAGGDLSGTYPNPGVAQINGVSLAGLGTGILKNTTGTGVPSIAVAADLPTIPLGTGVSGTLLAAQFPALTGDVTTSAGALATTLASTGATAASCGDTTHSCSLTVDLKGRITANSNNVIAGGAVSSVFTRTGAVVAAANDYTLSQIGLSPLTTSQDILYDNAGTLARLPIVTSGNCLGNTAGAWASLTCGGGSGTITSGTTNRLPKYTAATTIGNSLLSDDATTLTYTGTGGVSSSGPVASTSDGVHPGNLSLVGNTTVVTPASNTVNILGPSSATFTAYGLQYSATGPAAAGIPHVGTPSSGVSQVTFSPVVGADMTNNTVTDTQLSTTGATAASCGDTTHSCSLTITAGGRISANSNNVIAGGGLATQYTKLRCEPGLGDGLNAMPAGTYLQFECINDSGVTWTITGIHCWTDNAGTSTLNAANNAATGLLTGAVTCNNTKASGGAAGTQSGTTTLASGDAISFTFVADGTSKQTTWTVSLTQ